MRGVRRCVRARFAAWRVRLAALAFLAPALAACAAFAAEPQLVCFGTEPSWRLDYPGSGTARFSTPDSGPVEFRGSETRLDFLREWAWRGRGPGEGEGALVAFFRESVCSDGMSDVRHPVTARLSMPDGRLLAGCCRIPPTVAATALVTTLEGPVWRLAGLPGPAGKSLVGAVPPVTIRFDGGRVDGFSGCNQLVGGYAIDGDRVTIGPLAGTMMACDDAATTVENAVRGALTGTVRYAIAGERLTLARASGETLAFAAEPAPALEGAAWEVTGFNNGRHAVVSPRVGTTVTMSFRDGRVEGSGGCNTFRATYRTEGTSVVIGAAVATRLACTGEGVMAQEREFLAALQSATTWDVRGGLLDIHRADGERALTARQVVR